MLERHQAKVIQKPKQIKAKYGFCSMIKLQLLSRQKGELISTNEEVVIFSKENDANVLKRYKGEVVEVYQDDNQKWKLLSTIPTNNSDRNSEIQMNRLSHNGGANRNYYTNNNSPEISSIPSNTVNDIEDIIEDVPMLSNTDKKKIARFIDQQAALYKYTVNAVKKEFPELEGIDDRGIRSIALSLLINTNMVINRNL